MKLVIDNIEIPPGESADAIGPILREHLGLRSDPEWIIEHRSLDARDRRRIVFRYRVAVDLQEETARAALALPGVSVHEPRACPPAPRSPKGLEVVIVGAGPAGLFCALRLIDAGARVSVLERGRPVEERMAHIRALKEAGRLEAESSVLFGEGGARIFDGKLTTRIHRQVKLVLRTMVECGAPPEILYEAGRT